MGISLFYLVILSSIFFNTHSLKLCHCVVLYFQKKKQIVDKIKDVQAAYLRDFSQALAHYPSWGRLAGREQIETRQRKDDELEHRFQENDRRCSPLLSNGALTARLMLFIQHTDVPAAFYDSKPSIPPSNDLFI